MIYCAEIGSNHKGSKSLAFAMIREAAMAGADLIKFQLGHPRTRRDGISVYEDKIRPAPMGWAPELKQWCDYFGKEFFASIFSMEGLEVARSVGMERYKIAYKTWLDDPELCKEILLDNKPTYISGLSPTAKIDNAHSLFVIPEYPTYPEQFWIPERFSERHYGYSSHIHGIEDALIAIVQGARYVEKHVTFDRTEESIKDNSFAITFDEFRQMVDIGKGIARLI
jgi:sialic acid synthase SpsE